MAGKVLDELCKGLALLGVVFEVRHTGKSIYVKLTDCGRVKQIRISDHEGHKTSRNCWEIRKDRPTQRIKKIFAFNDVSTAIGMLSVEKER